MKRGKISNIEKFFVLNNKDKTPEQLAKELDRSVEAVKKILDENPVEDTTEENKSESEDKVTKVYHDEGRAGDLMGRKKRDGKKVATVMTPGASSAADDFRGQLPNKESRFMNEDTIHRPLDK